MFWRICAVVVVMVAMVACGSQTTRSNANSHLGPEIAQAAIKASPTLLIINNGIERFRVYGSHGLLALVYPGQTKCVRIYGEGVRSLVIRSIRESETTPRLLPVAGEGWVIELGMNLVYDVLTLQPTSICE